MLLKKASIEEPRLLLFSADDAFQLRIGPLKAVGAGLTADGPLELLFKELVDLFDDRLDLDAGPQGQAAVLLRRSRLQLQVFSDIAGRVRIRDVLPHDLQTDVGCLQGVAGHLDGTEKRHCLDY